jgi:chorismate mutase-like protein
MGKQQPARLIMDISDWRTKIDALDLQIVELLNQRAEAARAIGKLKESTEMPVYEPGREQVIFDNVRSHNRGPLPDSELVYIYQRVVAVMRCLQRNELASQQPDHS